MEEKHIGSFRHDPKNVRVHTARNAGLIERSLERDGFGRPMLAARDGTIIAGNQTMDSVSAVGMEQVIVVHSDGTKPIIVVRDDLDADSESATRLAIADNRATDLSSFDNEKVIALAQDMDLSDFWNEKEMERMLESLHAADGREDSSMVDIPPQFNVMVICGSEAQQAEVLEYCTANDLECRALIS